MGEGDKQSQQDEYYLLVTEVIGGISSEITNHENRLVKVEENIDKFSKKLDEIGRQQMILAKELMTLKSRS